MSGGPCLVLASASPRRQELVGLLGLRWRSAPQELPEEQFALGDPLVTAVNVALAKARAVADALAGDDVALGADTLVCAGDEVLGKPASAADARTMLAALRARAHTVATGVALRRADGREWAAVVATRVTMRDYASPEIDAYVQRGEPFDKAGGYAVQDRLFHPVDRLEGCYLNVVGLPLCAVARGLETLGIRPGSLPPGSLLPPCAYCHAGDPLVQIAGATRGLDAPDPAASQRFSPWYRPE